MRKNYILAQEKSIVLFTFLLAFFLSGNGYGQIDGKKLFNANCAACHKASEDPSVGPGLKGVMARIPGGDWKYEWIKNTAEMKAKDSYAQKIDKAWPGTMTPQAHLSNEEIDAILAYADKGEVKKGPVVAPGADVPVQAQEKGLSPLVVTLIIISLLIVLILVLRGAKNTLKNISNEKQGLPLNPERSLWEGVRHWMRTNKRSVALIVIILVSLFLKWGWDSMMGIGVYQGYKPEQPIAFSHKIHAGDNEIACQYCHSGVEKSKTAGIPPASVCMNCHKGITEGATTGTEEIAKIYEAVGWDPESQSYSKDPKGVKWIKVHNLPDFVYFNHSQHVKVGQIQCEQCHGDVKKMTVAEQFSPLTMSWCVDCHRTTDVKMEGNGYYQELHDKYKEKYKGQKNWKVTVSELGGLDCGKCHY